MIAFIYGSGRAMRLELHFAQTLKIQIEVGGKTLPEGNQEADWCGRPLTGGDYRPPVRKADYTEGRRL